jgi:Nicotianamine synthase protein
MLRMLETAETLMEFHYAEKFIKDTPNINNLKSFIYWDNYEKLVDIELNKFFEIVERKRLSSIAFVGSGPNASIIFQALFLFLSARICVLALSSKTLFTNPSNYGVIRFLCE